MTHAQPTPIDGVDPRTWGFGPLFDAIKDAVIVVDAAHGWVKLWNRGATGLFQYTPAEASTLRIEALVPPALRERHRAGLAAFHETGSGPLIEAEDPVEVPALRKDGVEVLVQLTLSRIHNPDDPGGRYAMAIIRDVTDLRKSEQILALILEFSGQATLALDLDGVCTKANRSAEELFGYPDGSLIGCNLQEALHHSRPDGSPFPAEECASLTKATVGTSLCATDVFWRSDGIPFPAEFRSEPIRRDGTLLGAVVTFEDITERLRAEGEAAERELLLFRRATTDVLTGVGNRRHADQLIESLVRGDAAVMLDVDHFKQVNDTRGHGEGDRVLVDLASFLGSQLREQDGLARYGGEEFLLVLRQGGTGAPAIMERIARDWAQIEPAVTFSVGVAVYEGQDRQGCVKSADLMLLEAKRQGRNRVVAHEAG